MKKFSVKISLGFIFLLIFSNGTQQVTAQSTNDLKSDGLYRDFKTEFMWDAKVTIANVIAVGESKRGYRQVIPITGGTFEGPKIKGIVLPSGDDWQLVRPDGDTEFYARYLLRTTDGYTIQIINQAISHTPGKDEHKMPYLKSVVDIEAPTNSPYDYLNHAIFIGTLKIPELKPGEVPYVIIGVYMVL
jgi:Protein of unknown function (DUF3237).